MTTTRRIITGISVAATLAAGAGTASAGQFNINSHGSYVNVPPPAAGQASSSGGQVPEAMSGHTDSYIPATIVRVSAAPSGFDWGDAGIGAGAGLAVSALLVGGGLAFTQRRPGGQIRNA